MFFSDIDQMLWKTKVSERPNSKKYKMRGSEPEMITMTDFTMENFSSFPNLHFFPLSIISKSIFCSLSKHTYIVKREEGERKERRISRRKRNKETQIE
jgi:hypothetical protein